MKERNIVIYSSGGAGRELADNLSYDPLLNIESTRIWCVFCGKVS